MNACLDHSLLNGSCIFSTFKTKNIPTTVAAINFSLNNILADGGFDSLPKVIDRNVTQPDTHIYACEAEDTLQSLLCCQLRRPVFYIWGARTRDIYQGKGLAKLLLVRDNKAYFNPLLLF